MDAPAAGLTIGVFARLSRLSAKALRRYDELGLLPPARVDADTGYRYYDETQLERARLVAWLRRVGMPLARIRHVCDLYETDTAAAARDLRAYWAQVEAETAARRDLATFLIGHLSAGAVRPADHVGKGVLPMPSMPSMPSTSSMSSTSSTSSVPPSPLGLRYAALADRGLVRETNQDTAYAGARLLAVADGFGAEGAPASTAAIDALKALPDTVDSGDLLGALADSFERANHAVDGFADSGTTLTAMVWTGAELGLVHIGDTRAYLLRDGEFFQLTQDHSVVRSMIDAGTLTEEEALSHPQRMMLLKALDGGASQAAPDLRMCEARAGDRYLLCSDGLSRVVDTAEVRRVVADTDEPATAVRELVELARAAGGPDNIACVVADVTEEPPGAELPDVEPRGVRLPGVVSRYLAAQRAGQAKTAAAAFHRDATVTDDGSTYTGIGAVEEWLGAAGSEYTYTVELTGVERLDETHYVVTNRLEGDFPGGIVDLHYRFALRDGLIGDLTIEP